MKQMTWKQLYKTLLTYGAKRYDLETMNVATEEALLMFVNYIKRSQELAQEIPYKSHK